MQTTSNILLIRPAKFCFNPETEMSNAFQIKVDENADSLNKKALAEFNEFAITLANKGINVFIFNDTESPIKPDAIFPNNWVSFHEDGTVILYPMNANNRQAERRPDILEKLKVDFKIKKVLDLSHYEKENKFLEGTGSVIFDHNNKTAYACISPRTDKLIFQELCEYLNYKPAFFKAADENSQEIYHTNVMMCIGEKFAVICLESISDVEERNFISNSLRKTGHQIIEISFNQMKRFAGNMLEIKSKNGRDFLVMSDSAFKSLDSLQKDELNKYVELLPLNVNMIEKIGGGSARCMIAEIFLPEKLH